MTTLSHFIAALRAHLLKREVQRRVRDWRDFRDEYPTRGCVIYPEMDTVDWDKVVEEIDAFAASFRDQL